jgi:hypothetical protein
MGGGGGGGRPTKSLDPRDRLGVYKSLAEVPDRYRLHFHADAYRDRDVWQEFCEEFEYGQGSYARFEEEVDRAGDRWRAHMAGRGRHHALAVPADVEAWCAALLDDCSERRAFDYWLRVNRFYDWLLWHPDHPHVYNPVLMAAASGGAAAAVWAYKARQNRERGRAYREEQT